MLGNRKGNFADVGTFMFAAIMIMIAFGVIFLFIENLNTGVQNVSNETIPDNVKATMQDYTDAYPVLWDSVLPMIYMAFVGFSVFAARKVPTSNKFIVVGIFAIIIINFAAMILMNFVDGFSNSSTLGPALQEAVITYFMLDHLIWFTFIYSIAVGIALYSKDD